jgi:ACS family glucarate transporter-like MFS transporter
MTGLSSTRWKIVWFLTLISLVRSMDAVNFSVAAKQIMPEYGLSNVQMGFLYTMYTLGYALFHLPGGLLADRVGPRMLLGAALLWWSIFTGLTAVAPQLPGLSLLGPLYAFLVVRFLIGLAEGACYPGSSRMIASWVAPDERASAGGLVISGLGMGYAITPPIVAFIMVHYGWRVAFYAFALLGILLALWWYSYATDVPERHPRMSPEELKRIRGDNWSPSSATKALTPWRAIFTNRSVWLLGGAGFCLGYGVFIYQAWFYLYLVNVRGFSEISGGLFTSGPFLAAAIFSPFGGLFSDAMVRRYGSTVGRRIGAILGFLLSAVCIGIGAKAENPYLAVLFLSFGDGFLYFAGASGIAAIIDIAGSHSGVTYGFSVTMTQIGGVVAPTLTPILADRFGWEVAIYAMALLAVIGSLFWLKVDANEKIVEQDRTVAQLGVALAKE